MTKLHYSNLKHTQANSPNTSSLFWIDMFSTYGQTCFKNFFATSGDTGCSQHVWEKLMELPPASTHHQLIEQGRPHEPHLIIQRSHVFFCIWSTGFYIQVRPPASTQHRLIRQGGLHEHINSANTVRSSLTSDLQVFSIVNALYITPLVSWQNSTIQIFP